MEEIQSPKVVKSIASCYYPKRKKVKKNTTNKTQVSSVLSNRNCQRLVELVLDPK